MDGGNPTTRNTLHHDGNVLIRKAATVFQVS